MIAISPLRALCIVLFLVLTLVLVFLACSDNDDTTDENNSLTSVTFTIDPDMVETGSEVTVSAAGMTLGDSIDVRMLLEGESSPAGVTYSINPMPEVDTSGSFTGILKINGTPVNRALT